MKLFFTYIVVLALIVLQYGCKTSQIVQSSVISKRYQKLNPSQLIKEQDSKIVISVDALPKSREEKKDTLSKTIFDLKSQGQKAFLEQYAKMKKGDDYLDILNTKYLEEEPSNWIDQSKKDYTLQFSVSEKDFYHYLSGSLKPGDRIEHLKILVTLDSDSRAIARFSNWNRFVTQYGSFVIGDLSFTASREMNINPSIPVAGSSLSLGNYDRKRDAGESDSLRREYILFNGVLHEDHFTIEQTGTPEKNLVGNSAVDLTLEFPSPSENRIYQFKKLMDKNTGSFNDPKKVKVTPNFILSPPAVKDLKATLTCDYEIRHINSGEETFPEGDDEITYYYGSYKMQDPIIFKVRDLKIKTWRLKINNNTISLKGVADNEKQDLLFSSYTDALDFISWLKYQLPKLRNNAHLEIDGYTFYSNEDELTNQTNLRDLKVKINL